MDYEEIDFRRTALGELLLRRRRVAGIEDDVFEVKLNDDLLMSSLLTESERALARRALAAARGRELHVLVGGLGLGHTAAEALLEARVRSVTVVELLPEVVSWHERGLVPLGRRLADDPRCRLVTADFYRALAHPREAGLNPPAGGYGAILVDIDHAPDSWLAPAHAGFYDDAGPAVAAKRLAPGGVFGYWSSGGPDERFLASLERVFPRVETHAITVWNPLVSEDQTDTIYVAETGEPDRESEPRPE